MPITLAKWSILSITLVILKDHPSFQLMIIWFILLISQILIIIGKPQNSRLENNITLFNELMTSIFHYGLYSLTDSMGRNESKEVCGLAMLVLVIFTIFINIFKVVIQAALMINFRNIYKKFTRKDTAIQLKPILPSDLSVINNISIVEDMHQTQIKMMMHQTSHQKTVSLAPENANSHTVLFSRQMQY
ncbi:hypothetical protein FGO68_gene16103 [Halteria grandinella]|uniref:Uncharacterized protein n=1 Tax=Halteria grandinella TaxID=5974 RepID=A0A8J8SW34_HALGN|nr:hypothetical protein FGO68_gene16103 [Halteria grandinella]